MVKRQITSRGFISSRTGEFSMIMNTVILIQQFIKWPFSRPFRIKIFSDIIKLAFPVTFLCSSAAYINGEILPFTILNKESLEILNQSVRIPFAK